MENCGVHPKQVMEVGFGGIVFCPICTMTLIQETESDLVKKDEVEAKERQKKVRVSRWATLDIGARFRNKSFDDYLPDNTKADKTKATCQRFAQTFKERLAYGDNLIMLGRAGTGKNHLAAAICRTIIEADYFPVHTTAIKLVRAIKDSWGDRSISEQKIIDQYTKPELLVIDEVGVQFGSQTELIFLMDVINSRYAEMKPTIMISNLDVQGLTAILGEAIVSRFYEGKSSVLNFDWEDYRRKKNS